MNNYYEKIQFHIKYIGKDVLRIFMRHTSRIFVITLAAALIIGLSIFYKQAIVSTQSNFKAEGVRVEKVNSVLYTKVFDFLNAKGRGPLPQRDIFKQ